MIGRALSVVDIHMVYPSHDNDALGQDFYIYFRVIAPKLLLFRGAIFTSFGGIDWHSLERPVRDAIPSILLSRCGDRII